MSEFTGPQRPSGDHSADPSAPPGEPVPPREPETPSSHRPNDTGAVSWFGDAPRRSVFSRSMHLKSTAAKRQETRSAAETPAPARNPEPSTAPAPPPGFGEPYPDLFTPRRTEVTVPRPVAEPLVVAGAHPEDDRGTSLSTDTTPLPRITVEDESPMVRRIREAWEGEGEPPPEDKPRPRRDREPRSPAVVLPTLILFIGIAAFFSWVSAEPFLISIGHHVTGTVTVNECHAEGFAPRCQGKFVPDSGGDSQPAMRITGDTTVERPGETVAAQAVSHDSTSVYIGDDLGLGLRWGLGLAIVVGCGFAIAWISGAWRFAGKSRLAAVAASMAAPLLIWLGALALTW
ncbi:hypothetical protein ACFQ3B_07395 [Stackebrandtia endophytica]|nr:hypothetical protein [Stackebrandtia endophytica]